MTGTGNPSAAINMVRKHATSREFKGDVSAEYGSWNKERYVADLQSHSPKTVKSAHELSAATRITTHGWTATTVKRPSSPALSMLI